MSIYYLHLEGQCQGNEEIPSPFGFFVHVLINNESEEEATLLAQSKLISDGMLIVEIRHCGLFESFSWDDSELYERLSMLAIQVEKTPGELMFSEFQSWLL